MLVGLGSLQNFNCCGLLVLLIAISTAKVKFCNIGMFVQLYSGEFVQNSRRVQNAGKSRNFHPNVGRSKDIL